jgi:hypothetical protein
MWLPLAIILKFKYLDYRTLSLVMSRKREDDEKISPALAVWLAHDAS